MEVQAILVSAALLAHLVFEVLSASLENLEKMDIRDSLVILDQLDQTEKKVSAVVSESLDQDLPR